MVKDDVVDVVGWLYVMGLQVVMIIGDNVCMVVVIVKQVGIEKVLVEVLLQDKVVEVWWLQDQGWVVVMVGDGVNDVFVLV